MFYFFILLFKLGLGMPPVSCFNLCPYMALVFGFENDFTYTAIELPLLDTFFFEAPTQVGTGSVTWEGFSHGKLGFVAQSSLEPLCCDKKLQMVMFTQSNLNLVKDKRSMEGYMLCRFVAWSWPAPQLTFFPSSFSIFNVMMPSPYSIGISLVCLYMLANAKMLLLSTARFT